MSQSGNVLSIQVAGPGCPRCNTLEQHVRDACAKLGLAAEISHLRHLKELAKLGVMFTPALIVDGKVVSSGRVLSVAEVKELLLGLTGVQE